MYCPHVEKSENQGLFTQLQRVSQNFDFNFFRFTPQTQVGSVCAHAQAQTHTCLQYQISTIPVPFHLISPLPTCCAILKN